jgi:hypothetical protein
MAGGASRQHVTGQAWLQHRLVEARARQPVGRLHGSALTLQGAPRAQASCSAPYCLDMRTYPMFRNSACMCAAQSLARVRELALAARNLSAISAVGARQAPNEDCILGPKEGINSNQR